MKTACRRGNLEMAKYLLEKIKKPKLIDLFCQSAFSDNLEIVKFLFEKGKLQRRVGKGITNYSLSKLITKNDNQKLALEFSCRDQSYAISEFLISKGASINEDILEDVCSANNKQLFRLFLEKFKTVITKEMISSSLFICIENQFVFLTFQILYHFGGDFNKKVKVNFLFSV